mmetsp:Transcript_3999/g.17702  ORF Transcript_3999/g.17702 Transcript_3999/m.17702 type:complete len:262 (+) Transcript_3999:2849-3634(+)
MREPPMEPTAVWPPPAAAAAAAPVHAEPRPVQVHRHRGKLRILRVRIMRALDPLPLAPDLLLERLMVRVRRRARAAGAAKLFAVSRGRPRALHRREGILVSRDELGELFVVGPLAQAEQPFARSAEHGPSLAILPLLDVRVERAGHSSLRGLPREAPDDPHADRGPRHFSGRHQAAFLAQNLQGRVLEHASASFGRRLRLLLLLVRRDRHGRLPIRPLARASARVWCARARVPRPAGSRPFTAPRSTQAAWVGDSRKCQAK